MVRKFSIQDFSLFGSSIDVVLTFEFGHDITILKMAIFDKVDYIDIEPALACVHVNEFISWHGQICLLGGKLQYFFSSSEGGPASAQ